MLKAFDIKPVLTKTTPPQSKTLVERVNKLILNMLVTKDIDNKVFNYMDSLGETLAYIAWEIWAYYHRTIMATPGKAVFVRDTMFNLS